jgi:predicted nuclease of predicted toxin-antitoxin system
MKILLDECMPHSFRFSLQAHGFEVQTVSYAGLSSYKNGKLLRIAENQFDVLVTLDKH